MRNMMSSGSLNRTPRLMASRKAGSVDVTAHVTFKDGTKRSATGFMILKGAEVYGASLDYEYEYDVGRMIYELRLFGVGSGPVTRLKVWCHTVNGQLLLVDTSYPKEPITLGDESVEITGPLEGNLI